MFQMRVVENIKTHILCSMTPLKNRALCEIQGDQKVFVHPMITVRKTRTNILNSFNHLP
jgi:hypothetical protein